jgi:hypothetical protein
MLCFELKNGSLFEPLFAYPIVDKGKGGCLFWRGFFLEDYKLCLCYLRYYLQY